MSSQLFSISCCVDIFYPSDNFFACRCQFSTLPTKAALHLRNGCGLRVLHGSFCFLRDREVKAFITAACTLTVALMVLQKILLMQLKLRNVENEDHALIKSCNLLISVKVQKMCATVSGTL